MSLNLDKSTWKRVRLGEVIRRSRTQVDPVSSGVERYVAGGHVDSEGVTIDRWGQVGDGQMGSTFRYVFQPGQILFVSARPYLRKVGVPDFSGVVADKTYVLDAVPENGLLQEFLPFVLSSESFVEYATAEATGSMNPRLLWGPMQRYEFDLPPLDEQKRLADLLGVVEGHRRALVEARNATMRERLHAVDRHVSAALAVKRVPLASVAEIRGGIQKGKPAQGVTVERPYLRVANVQDGALNLDEVKTIEVSLRDAERYSLKFGDVLLTEGGDIDMLGRGTVWRGQINNCLHQNHVFAVRVEERVASPEWIGLHTESAHGRSYFRVAAKRTSNLASVNKSQVSAFPVGVISLAEQGRVVDAIRHFDSAIGLLTEEINALFRLQSALLDSLFGGGK